MLSFFPPTFFFFFFPKDVTEKLERIQEKKIQKLQKITVKFLKVDSDFITGKDLHTKKKIVC